MPLEYTMHFAH